MSDRRPVARPPSGTPGAGLSLAGQVAAGALTARFTHDLNNYLTTILGKAELALLGADPTRMKSALEMSADAARRSRDLVAAMQRFTAVQRDADFASADPLMAVRPVLSLMTRGLEKSGITLDRRFGQVCSVVCDLGALSLSVYHLVRNSWQAMEAEGGRLLISVELKGTELEIGVQDTGPGLPGRVLEQVTRPDFPSADPNRGGLALAAFAARAHGGRLLAGTAPHGGAQVILRIPVRQQAA